MTKKQKKVLLRIIASTVLTGALMLISRRVEVPALALAAAFLVPYLIIGYDVLKGAAWGIGHKQVFDENFLMAVATVGAFCLGDYAEGAAVMLFYQIGELFQSIAVGRSRKNIAALMDIRPDYVNVYEDGKLVQKDPDEIPCGTEIIVNPGERVPIDGVLTEGSTSLDTKALTGESVPRTADVGDEIISGCINMTARIKMRTTKIAGESTVSRILELVENSAVKKSKTENFITRFARYYTPAVCGGALALAIIPPLACLAVGTPPEPGKWIIRALTFLVISCPCALVISVPLSFFGGIGCASSNGILVKGSNYLEALSKVKYMVFDKTGTLTKGVFEVTKINPAGGTTEEELLEMAAYAENASSHPISVSLRKAYGKSFDSGRIGKTEETPGYGSSAEVDGKTVLAGNLSFMEKHGISNSALCNEGTVVYVAIDGNFAGSIVIADTVKEQSKEALRALKKAGVRKNVMLTGDNESAASFIAEQLGIDEYASQLLPQNKVEKVEELLKLKGPKETLAFVGDGINDAPVLAIADVGIAMGGLGADAAIEAADVVIMDDNPARISLAMKISAKTLHITKENIIFALSIKAICLILGALGYAGMWLAVFADVGVMIIAVINAMRTLYNDPTK